MSDCLIIRAKQNRNAAILASCSFSVLITLVSKLEVIKYQDFKVVGPHAQAQFTAAACVIVAGSGQGEHKHTLPVP